MGGVVPAYVIFITDSASVVSGKESAILPDLEAVRHIVRQRLTDTMHAASIDNDKVELWADVFDNEGKRVLATRLTLRVIEP